MKQEQISFVARTALDAPIATFDTREKALAWADDAGDRFPGWKVTREVSLTIIKTTVLRRDRSQEERAA